MALCSLSPTVRGMSVQIAIQFPRTEVIKLHQLFPLTSSNPPFDLCDSSIKNLISSRPTP